MVREAIHAIAHSLNKCALSNPPLVPGTVLGAGATSRKKIHQVPILTERKCYGGRHKIGKIQKENKCNKYAIDM